MLVTLMTLFLWLAVSIGFTIGFVLIVDALLFFWRNNAIR